jgi:hypothetical protein
MGKLFEKVILKMVQSHIEVRNLLKASQSGFCALNSTTLQCMRLTDHMTLNFNKNMSKALRWYSWLLKKTSWLVV